MVRIRLSRRGKKFQPHYRIVVAQQQAKRDGRFIEHIGNYNPHTDPSSYNIDEARALHWLSVGAQPSDAVRRLLVKQGTLARLARIHTGEEIAALVAEFSGAGTEVAATEDTEAVVEETVAEVADAAVEEAVEEVADAAEEAVEEVSDAVKSED
ncbi:MAG: small subunit ribosomal protein S16 [Candidatus Promineifilaceae bacterium]|jgi:small subunit ribosomal protein S16